MLWNKNNKQSTPKTGIMNKRKNQLSGKQNQTVGNTKQSAIPSTGASKSGGARWPSQRQNTKTGTSRWPSQGKNATSLSTSKASEPSKEKNQPKQSLAGKALGGLKNIGQAGKNFLGNSLSKGKDGVNWLKEKGSNAVEGGKELLGNALEKGKDGASWLKEKGSNAVEGGKELLGNVLEKGKNGVNWLKEKGSNAVEGGKELLSNVLEKGKDGAKWLKEKGSNAIEAGKELIGNALEKGKDGFNSLKEKGKDAVERGKELLGDALEKGKDGVSWLKEKTVEKGKQLIDNVIEKGKNGAKWLKEKKDFASALLKAGKSTITNHEELVNIANEFGTTFGKADHSDERNITIEQAAVLAAHIYEATDDMIGGKVDIYKHKFGGSIEKDPTPDEILQVEGMENFRLEQIRRNEVEGSGDLKMGVYSQVLENGEKEYYIVNMGTNSENGSKGWENNFQNIDGNSIDMKESIDIARQLDEKYSDSKITMIGHSKGGGEAAANAVATNNDAIIFNPNTPFLSHYGLSEETQNYTGDMSMYVAKGEVLDTALSAVGYRGGIPEGAVNYLEDVKYTSQGWDRLNPKKAVQNFLYNHGLDSILYDQQNRKE